MQETCIQTEHRSYFSVLSLLLTPSDDWLEEFAERLFEVPPRTSENGTTDEEYENLPPLFKLHAK
jgi:hypothetical protein